ncbi:hypothetical protein [Rhodoferax sp.]|jgi:colicin import membrane protein|uniref:hypothetical protein n=1 Tax=Rhodoferax sp. TaxID=50421 RepID=UPI003782F572
MMWRGFALAMLLVSQVASGQSVPPAVPSDPAVERERIAQTRQQVSAQFDAERQACFQRFAVNSCLADVAARRRSAVGVLQHQEHAISQEQRAQRAAHRVRVNEDKARARQARDSEGAAAE